MAKIGKMFGICKGKSPLFLYFEVILEEKLTVKDIDKITSMKPEIGAF